MPGSMIPWETLVQNPVAHHPLTHLLLVGLPPLPPPHPFLETARPEADEAETDRDLKILTDASHYSPVHEL